MTAALDANQRTTLERLVTKARRLLEDDLLERASGRYGIDPDGTIADEDALRLDPTALVQRRELVDVVHHLRSEGEDARSAVSRLLREATFTHLNRLVAIRIAEALSLLPPSLANGRTSQGFRDLLELVPSLADDDTGGYWTYLSLCGDELAGDVPALFDPRNPLLTLAPSPSALDVVVDLIAAPDAADLWLAPDCLGWVYQFFNTGDERRAMREGSAAPRDSRELAVRNQFFTPRYVVDFLVQNSLGRRLIDADPTSPLLDDLPLLIDPPTEAGESLELSDASMLDPACGSGHFLLAGYDVLERAWHHAGVDAATAAPTIVQSLWGIDIDPRCAQVAAAAIIFRARRSCPDGDLPRPNIICARALPATATGLDDVLAALPARARQLVAAMSNAMSDAPILGSLLKIEERLSTEVRAAAFGGASGPGSLAEELPDDTLQALEHEILTGLRRVAEAATATPAERLLAAEADDAIRFVHALQRRHDAVCMNPPFGEPVPESKQYLRQAYPWIPTRDFNLLAAFVGRGLELCKPTGHVGAITSRAGLFQITFQQWREEVLLSHRLRVVADLGFGVMEQAMVEAAAYVVGAARSTEQDAATFVRLLRDGDRASALSAEVTVLRTGSGGDRSYTVRLGDFGAIPGKPLAYWVSPSIRRLFAELPPTEGHGAEARQGLASGDDFRFVRAIWEVSPANIATSRASTESRRWAPFAKGGEYSPYWADINLVIDWERDGKRVREYPGSAVRNPAFYFRPGLTWPDRATTLAPRVLPAGCVFSHVGMGLFPIERPLLCLAWTNSRLGRVLADFMVSGREESRGVGSPHYYVGVVQRVPWPGSVLDTTSRERVEQLCGQLVDFRRSADVFDETTRSFVAPATIMSRSHGVAASVASAFHASHATSASAVDASYEIDQLFLAGLAIPDDGLTFLDEEAPPSPASYPRARLTDDERIEATRLATLSMKELVAEAVARCGGSRSVVAKSFVSDRKVELIAQVLQRHPESVGAALSEAGWLPDGEVAAESMRVLSYLVGCAFGRWDVRVSREAESRDREDPFDPISVHPPGALAAAPPAAAYPLALPSDGVLLDQAAHQWDIEASVRAAAAVVVDDVESVLAEITNHLGRGDLRSHIRRQFFKSHLAMYTVSRRKAPIYWPLYVPSGAWGLWVYAPSLQRETLFAIARFAGERLDQAEAEIRRLVRERDAGGAGRSDRAVANALGAEESLAEELRRFRDEAERIAGLGWEPDLDDGIILCAAPLADLFPAWKDAATTRKDLKAGKYAWATVAKWADQL